MGRTEMSPWGCPLSPLPLGRGLCEGQGRHDHFTDAVETLDDVCVPEAKYGQAEAFQVGGAAVVVVSPVDVLAAVQLNDERCVGAEEVNDIGTARDLALPLPAGQAAVAQAPQSRPSTSV